MIILITHFVWLILESPCNLYMSKEKRLSGAPTDLPRRRKRLARLTVVSNSVVPSLDSMSSFLTSCSSLNLINPILSNYLFTGTLVECPLGAFPWSLPWSDHAYVELG